MVASYSKEVSGSVYCIVTAARGTQSMLCHIVLLRGPFCSLIKHLNNFIEQFCALLENQDEVSGNF